eukprot:765143-Hanusia_phi.AAC.4
MSVPFPGRYGVGEDSLAACFRLRLLHVAVAELGEGQASRGGKERHTLTVRRVASWTSLASLLVFVISSNVALKSLPPSSTLVITSDQVSSRMARASKQSAQKTSTSSRLLSSHLTSLSSFASLVPVLSSSSLSSDRPSMPGCSVAHLAKLETQTLFQRVEGRRKRGPTCRALVSSRSASLDTHKAHSRLTRREDLHDAHHDLLACSVRQVKPDQRTSG